MMHYCFLFSCNLTVTQSQMFFAIHYTIVNMKHMNQPRSCSNHFSSLAIVKYISNESSNYSNKSHSVLPPSKQGPQWLKLDKVYWLITSEFQRIIFTLSHGIFLSCSFPISRSQWFSWIDQRAGIEARFIDGIFTRSLFARRR